MLNMTCSSSPSICRRVAAVELPVMCLLLRLTRPQSAEILFESFGYNQDKLVWVPSKILIEYMLPKGFTVDGCAFERFLACRRRLCSFDFRDR